MEDQDMAIVERHRSGDLGNRGIDLLCVRMTAINLALRNLAGYVIHGNSLTNECRLIYETG